MAEREVARALIVNEKGEVMLGKRARGHSAGKPALFGGKPEPEDLNIEATVVREVREETGLEFEPIFWKEELDTESDHPNRWRVYYYTGRASGEIVLDESENTGVVYASPDNLAELDVAFTHKRILEEYFDENMEK